MKTVEISDEHYEVLIRESKRYRIKIGRLVEEMIEENYPVRRSK